MPSAAAVTLMLSGDAVQDGIERRARTHGLRGLLGVRPEIAADVDRPPLSGLQLGDDLGLVFGELPGHLGEARLELLVLRLRRERLRPVQGEVEVAAPRVELADLP